MRVLVACEFSGVVRDAFRALGHDAMSVDLLPSERPGPHYQGDVLDFLRLQEKVYGWSGFDLLIAHPPCTYLANSGVRWLYGGKGNVRDRKRWRDMVTAAEFFARLLNAPIEKVAVENPIMHRYARAIIEEDVKAPYTVQTIQPWQYGHGETKATQLWLRNLPPLQPTDIVSGRAPRVHHASPGADRWKERSRTLQGIADAMAEQWGAG